MGTRRISTTRLAAGLSVILLCLAGSSLADVAPSRADPGGRADRSRRLVFRRDTCPGDPGDGKQCNSTSLQRSLTRTDKDYDSGTYVGNNSMCLKLMKEDHHGLALLTKKDQRIHIETRIQSDRRRSSSRTNSRRSQVIVEAGTRGERRSPTPENLRRTDDSREGRRRLTARSVERRTKRNTTLADGNRRMSENGIRRRVTDQTERASLRVETRRVIRTERNDRVIQADRRRERSTLEASSTRRSSRTADEWVRSPVESVRSRRTSVTERRDDSSKERLMAQKATRQERRFSSAEHRVSPQADSERTQQPSRVDRRISSVERRTSSADAKKSQQSSSIERRVSSSERRTPSPDSSRIERSVSFVERRTPSPVAAARTEQSSRMERRSVSADETTRSTSRRERARESARVERRVVSVEAVRARQTSRVERRGSSAERRAQDSRELASRIERRISSTAEETARTRQSSQRRIASVERRSRTERRLSLSAERSRSSIETSRTRQVSSTTRSPVSADGRIQTLPGATRLSSRSEDRRLDGRRTSRVDGRVYSAEIRTKNAERTRKTPSMLRRISTTDRRTSSPVQAERNTHVSRSDRRSLSRDRTSEASTSRISLRRSQERTDSVRTREHSRNERRASSVDGRIQSRLDRRTDRIVASLSRAETTRSAQSSMSDRRLKRSPSVGDKRTIESLSRSFVTRRLKGGTERQEERRTNSQRQLKTETAAREDNVQRRASRRTDSGTRRMSVDSSRRLAEETVVYRRSDSGERSADSNRRVRVGSETRSARRVGERLIRESAERTRDHRTELGLVRVSRKSDSTRQIRRIVSGGEVSLHRQTIAATRDGVYEKSLRRVAKVDDYDTLQRSSLNDPKSIDDDNLRERRNLKVTESSQRIASRESLYRRMVNILPHDSRLERRQQETRNMRRISATTRRQQGERQKENLQRKYTNEARRLDNDRRKILLTTSRRTPLVKLSFNDLQTDERRSQPANKQHASMRKVWTGSAEGKSRRTKETATAAERREISLTVRASDDARETQTRRNMRADKEARRRSLQVASIRQKERVDARTKTTSERRGLSTDVAESSHRRAHETNALSVRNSRLSMTRLDGSRRRMASDHVRSQDARLQRRVERVLQQKSTEVSPTEATRVHRGGDVRRSASETREFARSSRGLVGTTETIRTVRSSTLDRHSRLATSEHLARKSLSATEGLRRLQHGHDSSARSRSSTRRTTSSERSVQTTTTRTVDVREDDDRRHAQQNDVTVLSGSRIILVDRESVSRRETRLSSKLSHLNRISDNSRRSASVDVLERAKKSVKRSDERHGVTNAIPRARSFYGRRLSDKASREDRRLMERTTSPNKSYRHEESTRENEARRSVDSLRASRQSGSRKAFSSESQRNVRAMISSLSTSQIRTVRDSDKEGPRYSRRTSAQLMSSRNDELTRRRTTLTTKVEDSHMSAAAIKDFKTEENQLSVPAFARPDLKDNDVPDNYVSYVLAAILIGATIFYDSLVNSSLEASLPNLDRPREMQPSMEDELSASKGNFKEMELAGKSRATPGFLGSILAGVTSVHLF